MTELFVVAARQKFRFPSTKGELLTEQLFDLPLKAKNGFDLDSVARAIYTELKQEGEESFVATSSSPRRTELTQKLDLVKYVIQLRQSENAAAAARVARAEERRKLEEALASVEQRELASATREELQARIAALDAGA